ncbi:TetR/AcrR family transcriptional regulator [Bradyrhizobium sp. SYSU BS000235]|uniref:TetR/AcrR family transcriptional regulator n=1 Tax=Bradyrhizobium sp. SYSU BS000235 TaxID=3411332 RepID=UPI003C7231EA
MGAQGATKRAKVSKPAKASDKASPPARKAVADHKAVVVDHKSTQNPDRQQPYHHGDLHGALLKAAKRVAEREGIGGLTLRAVAREAGVSHAAPAHHFGDVSGLLSELAAIGFGRFSDALDAGAQAAGSSPDAQAEGRANAYVAFAKDNPCMFQLMFRAERLDHNRPALHEAREKAFAKLAAIVSAKRHEDISTDRLTLAQAADIARIWSMVHGFAMLRLDGRLRHILNVLPPGTTEEMLLAAMLKSDRPAES